tara:strand:+ start:1931 stop:2749 length:819 start_codon:yes stop_codon:yes gene_type:complete
MDWLHSILNLIGLLFWVLWRAGTLLRPKPSNALAGPTPRPGKIFKHSWVYLIGLIVLLTLRAVFYNQFGPGLNWTPSMELIHEAPHFRSDFFPRALAYSILSFSRWLIALYICFALLITIIPKEDSSGIWGSFLRCQFSRLGKLQTIALWVTALLLASLLHIVEIEWMTLIGVRVENTQNYHHLPLLVMLDFRAATYLTMVIVSLYILNSFIYFGEKKFWKKVDDCGKQLLAPIRKIPLMVGKLDLAPFVVMAFAYGLSYILRHDQLALCLQ